jgi:hypothetical protein
MAEESTDGEVETQVYNQDSQNSFGEVSKNRLKICTVEINGSICPFENLSLHLMKHYWN